jgi:lysophospholipase L1-like esterase
MARQRPQGGASLGEGALSNRAPLAAIGWALLGGGLLCSSLLPAQEDVVAFGDSITEGPPVFDERNEGGYPGRLQVLLRDAGMTDIVVLNEGLSSETTFEGLTRIESVIDQHADRAGLFILMEGTNDVNRVAQGEISLESTVQNLEAMAAKVRSRAIDVLYSSIIPRPPWAKLDRFNSTTYELVFRLRELTSAGNRTMAEPWEYLENLGIGVFDTRYFCCDPVGHPNAAGFDLLAEIYADKILGRDTLAPVVSLFAKTGRAGVLEAGDRLLAVLHESGEGIRKSDSYLTVNGRAVPSEAEGSKRRVELSFRVSAPDIGCAARITVHTEDEASPANVRNRKVAELAVEGRQQLKGDINGDCRVDGFDLGLLGLSFGSRRGEVPYSVFADSNGDGEIDGEDLARLARNFGKRST